MPDVSLRAVEDADMDLFFEHQRDPESERLTGVAARDRAAFDEQWLGIRANGTTVVRTIVADFVAVGNLISWEHDGIREVGYRIGREHWNSGITSRALGLFVEELPRPLHAWIAEHNIASQRVAEKSGFVRSRLDGDYWVYELR
jgi:RimJ/RimL family protein N-acetyltransferase